MHSNVFIIYELRSPRQVTRRLKPSRAIARVLHVSSTTWFQTSCLTAVLKSNLIRPIEFGTAVARHQNGPKLLRGVVQLVLGS